MSQILQSKISTVRRKHVGVAAATGVAAAVGAFVLLLALSMLLDFWLDLSWTARAALLAVNLAAVVSLLLYAVVGPVLYGPDDDEIALMVEDAEPAFRTRLIASVQLSRAQAAPAGASTSLIRAMVAQAESLAGPMDFARVVKTDALLRIVVTSLLIVIVAVGTYAYGRPASADLLSRAFLSNTPVPRKTRVVPVTTNLLIARGDSVEILALADGTYPPEDRRLLHVRTTPDDKAQAPRKQDFTLSPVKADAQRLEQIKQRVRDAAASGGRPQEATAVLLQRLDAEKDGAPLFAATIENVQEPFEYTIRLNDGESEKFAVRVMPRPAVTRVDTTQVYPGYTGRAPEPRKPGDLTLLQGSKLQLAVAVNKTLKRPAGPNEKPNFVHLIGVDRDVPLRVDDKNAQLLTGEIDLPKGTTGFSINLTDEYGLKSRDPAIYRVDLIPDKAPTVRITLPTRKEIPLVREGRQRVAFEAVDDFAIGAATLKYKVDDGEERSVKLDLQGKTPRSFPGAYDWKLADVQPASATRPMLEGSVIEYWVEVEDTRTADFGGPNKGASDHYMIRVVSEPELRGILAARIADIGSGLRTAAEDQEAVANRVGTLLLERQPDPQPALPAPE
jgi:hypothetical protein